MRYSQIAVALFLATVYPLKQAPAFADQAYGSYAADGQCFCLGELSTATRSRIVPTPIGGQSVAQICSRIGRGPGLEKSDGLYNYPVYKDAQCGHGPFEQSTSALDKDCSGTLDGTYGTCKGVGPRWDFERAFGRQAAPAAARPLQATEADGVKQNVVTTTQVDDKRSATNESLKATVIRSSSVAGRELPAALKNKEGDRREGISNDFAGRSITIDGQRYLQARTGMQATGGTAGSRIILDDLVFLRDDGMIDPADLFQQSTESVNRKSDAKNATLTPQAEKPSNSLPRAASSPAAGRAAQPARSVQQKAALEIEKREKEAHESRALAAMLQERQARKDRLTVENPVSESLDRNLDDMAAVERGRRLVEQYSRQSMQLETQARKEAQASQAQAMKKSEVAQKQALLEELRSQPEAGPVENAPEKLVQADNQENLSVPSSAEPMLAGALGLPNAVSPSFRNFAYIEALPANFDVGGNGILLEGSAHSHSHIQYIGRVGFTETFSNILLGGGYFLTPPQSDRVTVVFLAGLEHGNFELSDDVRAPGQSFNSTDTGLHISAETRFVVNRKFELKGGAGYSSYFEGDARIFGGGYYHLSPRLDILSRFEIGDNDLLGIGIRYYY